MYAKKQTKKFKNRSQAVESLSLDPFTAPRHKVNTVRAKIRTLKGSNKVRAATNGGLFPLPPGLLTGPV